MCGQQIWGSLGMTQSFMGSKQSWMEHMTLNGMVECLMQHACPEQTCMARRQRIWGSLGMTQSFMGDKQCWMEHMSLNATDGLDPEGIALRASEGLLGIDYFFPGYAVWAGLIEAAADLGYDTNNLVSSLLQGIMFTSKYSSWHPLEGL